MAEVLRCNQVTGLACTIPEESEREITEDTFTPSMPNSESSGFGSADVISPTDTPPESVDRDVDAESAASTETEPESFPDTDEEQIFEMSPDDDGAAGGEDFLETETREGNINCGGKHEQPGGSGNVATEDNEEGAIALLEENSGATANLRSEIQTEIATFPLNELKISAAPGYERKREFAFGAYGQNKELTSLGNDRIARGYEDEDATSSLRCEQHGIASSWRCEEHGVASSWRCEEHGVASSWRCEKHGVASSWRCEEHGIASSWRCEEHGIASSWRCEEHGIASSLRCEEHGIASSWRCAQHGAAASSRNKHHGTSTRGCEKHGATASRKYWKQGKGEFVGYEGKTGTASMQWKRQVGTEFLQSKQLRTAALLREDKDAKAVYMNKKEKAKKRTVALTKYKERKVNKERNEEREDERGTNENATAVQEQLLKNEEENTEYYSLFNCPLPSENGRSFPCSEDKLRNEEADCPHVCDFDDQEPEPEKVIMHEGRDVLDLFANITNSSWLVTPTRLQKNNLNLFFANRSQYHRLNMYGAKDKPFLWMKCKNCRFRIPVY